jgi:hypothetical protein
VKPNFIIFNPRQLIYNYPEQLFADAGVIAIEHADFEGVERLALVLGSEIVSTFGKPELVKLGHCKLIEEVMIGEDQVSDGHDDNGDDDNDGNDDDNGDNDDDGNDDDDDDDCSEDCEDDDDNDDGGDDGDDDDDCSEDCDSYAENICLNYLLNIILVNPFLWLCSERGMHNRNTWSYATDFGRGRTLASRCFVRPNTNCQRNSNGIWWR